MADGLTDTERFLSKLIIPDNPNACWGWKGSTFGFGYGRLSLAAIEYGGKMRPVGAHRFSWEHHNGPIPKGLFVLHTCDNPPCCNPRHLWLGTIQDNNLDCIKKGRRPRNKLGVTKQDCEDTRRSVLKKLGVKQRQDGQTTVLRKHSPMPSVKSLRKTGRDRHGFPKKS